MLDFLPTNDLRHLRGLFQAKGFDIRLVGGCVRDLLMNKAPKDIDLCTDADPEEQIAIYREAGLRYIETGLQHGTVTVVLSGMAYEITSLRTETDHDGRHAVVQYTRDWTEDLSRRDLTINAMALTFDGELIDLFGGKADLEQGIVRFVGDADERIREDYLRILRWLRFHGRISPDRPLDPETVEAVKRNAAGLSRISRERIWSEVSKIIVGPGAAMLMEAMVRDLGLAPHMDLPHGSPDFGTAFADPILACMTIFTKVSEKSASPVTRMVAFLIGGDHVVKIAQDWRWSREERDLGMFVADYAIAVRADLKRYLAHRGHPREWVLEVARFQNRPDEEIAELETWDIPVFPLKGADLLEEGYQAGPTLGKDLAALRTLWADLDYTATKDQLLAYQRKHGSSVIVKAA